MKLKDQAIIITGGASGIGYQTALQLAEHGANLIIADRSRGGGGWSRRE